MSLIFIKYDYFTSHFIDLIGVYIKDVVSSLKWGEIISKKSKFLLKVLYKVVLKTKRFARVDTSETFLLTMANISV